MSRKELTFEDVLSRINNNFSFAKSTKKMESTHTISTEYHQLQMQLATELEQVNRGWNVDSEFMITSHRGNFGKIIVSGKKIIRKFLRWYINPLFFKQKSFNASVTRTLNFMKESSKFTKEILDGVSLNDALIAEKIDELVKSNEQLIREKKQLTADSATLAQTINDFIVQQNTSDSLLNLKIEGLTKELSVALDHIAALKEQLSIEHNNQQQLKNILGEKEQNIYEKIESTNEMLSFVRRKLKKNESSIEGPALIHNKVLPEESTLIEQKNNYSMDYLLFENRFRGSRSSIKERQKQYLEYILPTDKVLDIGCGRGEFIELLTDNGISVNGIDINEDMVEYCIDRGFNVQYADAIDYLAAVPPQTYDCISMCQVIEHLTFEQYTELLGLMLNALKPGGKVIIETINAQSVYAMSNWFYIDPTHTKPVHPETLDFVIKEIGFHKTERKNVSPVEHINVPQIGNIENSEEINRAIGDLYGMLYGYQDYALIAWR